VREAAEFDNDFHLHIPGVILLDSHMKVLEWDESVEVLSGIKKEETIGEDFSKIIEKVLGEKIAEEFREFFVKEEKAASIVSVELPTGKKHIAFISTPVKLQGRRFHIIFLEDLTEEFEKEWKYRLILENIRDVIALVDFEGKILYVSPSVEVVFGFKQEERVGRSIFENIHPEDVEKVQRVFRRILREGVVDKVVCRYRRKDGKYIWVEAVGKPIFNKNAGVISVRDVTEVVTLEGLLRTINCVSKVIMHSKSKDELLEKACLEMAKFFPAVNVWLKEEDWQLVKSCGAFKEECGIVHEVMQKMKPVIKTCESCGRRKAAFPMITDGELKGVLVAYLNSVHELDREEVEMLDVLANDIAFALKTLELEEAKRKAYMQIEDNIYKFAILVDEIKNPLMAILSATEQSVEDERTKEIIIQQVNRIMEIVRQLDRGWIESEKVREFLRKYL